MDLTGMSVLRFGSHRARSRAIGRRSGILAVWSWKRAAAGGFYALPDADAAGILQRGIPGVTRLRAPYDDLRQCWNG
jgi:hypothetical protein